MPPRSRVRRVRENEEADTNSMQAVEVQSCNNSKSDSYNRSEFHPLNRVVYAQLVMKFAATKMSNMVRLSATCETWRDTFENYGHVIANAALKHNMGNFMLTAKSIHMNVKKKESADDAIWRVIEAAWRDAGLKRNLLVVDYSADNMKIIDLLSHQLLKTIGSPGEGAQQLDGPCHAAVLPDGKRIAVCDASNNRIQVLDMATGTFTKFVGNGKGNGADQFNCTFEIAFTSSGLAVITDFYNHRLQVVDLETGQFRKSIGNGEGKAKNQLKYPQSVAISKHDIAYVVEVVP